MTVQPVQSVGPRQWIGLAVLALPTLLLSMDVTVLYLVVPHLAADLRPTDTQLLWITDSYGFMISGFLVTMGTLGDRIGRRRLLVIGSAAFLAASVVAAFAPSAEMLIIARGALGVAGATLMPSTLALISNMFLDPRQRGTAVGIWAACLSGGVALGPIVGGALLEWFWWGSAFLIAVPVMGLLVLAAPVLLPEYRDPDAGRIDLTSVALSLVGVLPIIYGVKQAADGGSPALSIALIAFGAAASAVFIGRQRRLCDPLIDLRLFGNLAFSTALVVLLLGLATAGGVYLFVTLLMQQVIGLSPMVAGLWLLPSSVAMIVTSVAAPALARRVRPGLLVGASLGVAAIGFLLLTQLDRTSGLLLVVAGIVIVYIGQGPVMALGTELVVGAAPPEKAGAASAISETSSELGLALGGALLGSIGFAADDLTSGATLVAGISAAITAGLAVLAAVALRQRG